MFGYTTILNLRDKGNFASSVGYSLHQYARGRASSKLGSNENEGILRRKCCICAKSPQIHGLHNFRHTNFKVFSNTFQGQKNVFKDEV